MSARISALCAAGSEVTGSGYRTDFASWQQRIRLYCRGKENGVNILKSINEGPFQMGTFTGRQIEVRGYNAPGGMFLQLVMGEHRQSGNAKIQGIGGGIDEEQLVIVYCRWTTTALLMKLWIEQPVWISTQCRNNVFQADDCCMLLILIVDEGSYSTRLCHGYTSILFTMNSIVKDNDPAQVQVVIKSNVYFVPNDAYMMIFNDMYEPHVQTVSVTTRNTVVDNSLTAELATYKEQVELYERRPGLRCTTCLLRKRIIRVLHQQKQLTLPKHIILSQDLIQDERKSSSKSRPQASRLSKR
ncbi:hypothetical protein Tco_0527351 [Tanacetum coccineum]